MNVFEVEAPGGGKLILRSQEEVDLYDEMSGAYERDYRLVRQSEKILLGSILGQALILFRAQQEMTGMEQKHDAGGVPLAEYEKRDLKPADRVAIQKTITEATKEIREIEKALGIDKKSRDAGGQESIALYILNLKKAANRMGIHIFRRVKLYEEVVMQLSWRLRLLKNGDDEDKQYHDISPEKICAWADEQIAMLADFDKMFAKTQARLFGGKL